MYKCEKPIGLYIHVPFCTSKCPYCDFYSIPLEEELANAYTEKVCFLLRNHPFGALQADTLYFGGGTPALLGAKRLGLILEAAQQSFSISQQSEITLEANPTSALFPLLRDLYRIGFNRISFGVQSLQDNELQALGRLHNASEARDAILDAKNAGFDNISADVMLGIPFQTQKSLKKTLDAFYNLPLKHISAYLLKVEPQTPFATRILDLPNEDIMAQLYLATVEQLEASGFFQYEISNFSKSSYSSKHNLKYWRCEPYLGVGPAAYSFLNGKRFSFPASLSDFLKTKEPFSNTLSQGVGGGWEEEVMLRLRLSEGLDVPYFSKLYSVDSEIILQKANNLAKHDLLRIKNGVISLTPKGFLVSNSIISHLV